MDRSIYAGPTVLEVVAQLDEELRYEFEERAGIFEYEAGMSRSEAESSAYAWLTQRYPRRT